MVWPFGGSQTQQQSAPSLNLGLAGGQQTMQPQFGGFNGAQQQQQNPFMAGMGVPQGPVMPPSELEIIAMLQQTSTPVDAWLATGGLQQVLGVISGLITLNLIEFFRNAKFVDDGDDGLKVDVSSLPSEMQTMSVENITAELGNLQAAANTTVQNSIGRQQQILQYAQQSMMGGMFSAAMANEGLMEKAGSATGNLVRGALGLPVRMR